jgi:hypothetical protein
VKEREREVNFDIGLRCRGKVLKGKLRSETSNYPKVVQKMRKRVKVKVKVKKERKSECVCMNRRKKNIV